MISQTFNIITVPITEPKKMPSERAVREENSTAPVMKVTIAAHLRHFCATGTNLVKTSTVPASVALAK